MEIPFEYVSDDDDEDVLSNVKVIVCLPLTTASTTGHCVDFILREGGNCGLSLSPLAYNNNLFLMQIICFQPCYNHQKGV